MAPSTSGAAAYRAMSLENAGPVRLTAVATRGAALEAGRARQAMQAGNVAEFAESLSRATSLIGVLREGLDLARGEDLARNLDRIYVYMQLRLMRASISRDQAILDEVESHLDGLASAWEAADN